MDYVPCSRQQSSIRSSQTYYFHKIEPNSRGNQTHVVLGNIHQSFVPRIDYVPYSFEQQKCQTYTFTVGLVFLSYYSFPYLPKYVYRGYNMSKWIAYHATEGSMDRIKLTPYYHTYHIILWKLVESTRRSFPQCCKSNIFRPNFYFLQRSSVRPV